MTKPAVSIIVPCRNERATIERAIESMLAQHDVPGEIEVVVADGRSDDGTREILDRIAQSDDRIRVIDNPGLIVSTGLNLAIAAARADVIVRMDTHSEYASDYVARCLEALQSTGALNVGGPALTRAEGFFQCANALAYQSPYSVGGAKFHDPRYEGWVDTVTYGCWHKETLLRIGLFDEALVRNQDDELNLRLVRSGGRIWQTPRIRSWYRPRASWPALFKQYLQYGYWKVRVIRKHKVPASFRHLVPGLFVGAMIALAPAAFAWPLAGLALASLVLGYVSMLFVASLAICARASQWKYVLVMPAVLAAYHLGYGAGFVAGLIGLLDSRGRVPRAFSNLTR